MNATEICRKILLMLRDYADQYGLNRYAFGPDTFLNAMNISDGKLKASIDFLEGEGYIIVQRALGSHFVSAGLTSKGYKLLMDESEFNREFRPNSQVTIVTGNNNVTGSNIDVHNSFNKTDHVVEESALDDEMKAELKTLINDLLKTTQNNKVDENKVKKFLTTILSKASDKTATVALTTLINSIITHFS